MCDKCDIGVYVSCVYLVPFSSSRLAFLYCYVRGMHAADEVAEGQRQKGPEDWPWSKNQTVDFNRFLTGLL